MTIKRMFYFPLIEFPLPATSYLHVTDRTGTHDSLQIGTTVAQHLGEYLYRVFTKQWRTGDLDVTVR
jgi:hypothetical protein